MLTSKHSSSLYSYLDKSFKGSIETSCHSLVWWSYKLKKVELFYLFSVDFSTWLFVLGWRNLTLQIFLSTMPYTFQYLKYISSSEDFNGHNFIGETTKFLWFQFVIGGSSQLRFMISEGGSQCVHRYHHLRAYHYVLFISTIIVEWFWLINFLKIFNILIFKKYHIFASDDFLVFKIQ